MSWSPVTHKSTPSIDPSWVRTAIQVPSLSSNTESGINGRTCTYFSFSRAFCKNPFPKLSGFWYPWKPALWMLTWCLPVWDTWNSKAPFYWVRPSSGILEPSLVYWMRAFRIPCSSAKLIAETRTWGTRLLADWSWKLNLFSSPRRTETTWLNSLWVGLLTVTRYEPETNVEVQRPRFWSYKMSKSNSSKS